MSRLTNKEKNRIDAYWRNNFRAYGRKMPSAQEEEILECVQLTAKDFADSVVRTLKGTITELESQINNMKTAEKKMNVAIKDETHTADYYQIELHRANQKIEDLHAEKLTILAKMDEMKTENSVLSAQLTASKNENRRLATALSQKK